MKTSDPAIKVESPCRGCGACCSCSSNWPRFTTEDDAALDLIPEKFVNDRLSGMRCDGERCSALTGRIGIATACAIYAVRPEVCRTCMPGDAACTMARRGFGLPVVSGGERNQGGWYRKRRADQARASSRSSKSSSNGENLLSGLVESVIGLRWPYEETIGGDAGAPPPRAESRGPTR